MKTIRFIDLFAGIGGFRYGLEKAGKHLQEQSRSRESLRSYGNKSNNKTSRTKAEPICDESKNYYKCVYSNEWDKYASQVYKKHFGECDTRDITIVPSSDIPDFDLLVGGFPCQAFSIAGKRRGFQDTRGTLFFEIARILADKRPRYLLLENVKGLLSHDNGKTFQTILGVLTDLGYVLQWEVLNSKNFGVPQNRERVFIIGNLAGTRRPKVFPITEEHRETNELREGRQQSKISGTITARYHKMGNADTYITSELEYIGGIEGKRKKWLDNGKNNSRNFSQGQRVYGINGIASTLAGNAGGLGGKTGLYAIRQPLKFLQRNQKNIEGNYSFTVDGANTGGVKIAHSVRVGGKGSYGKKTKLGFI